MARQALLFSAFLLFLNISLVLCRDDYNQYFSNHFSHHHRKSTPQDGVPSAEAAVSASEGIVESSGKQHGFENDDDFEEVNDVLLSTYKLMVIIVIVSLLVSVGLLVTGLVIIFYCGKGIGRTVRQGFVLSRPAIVQPQQPAYAESPQLNHNPQGEELQKVPPPYTPQPPLYPPAQQQLSLL